MNQKVLVIAGPTGSGKTDAALAAAHALGGEVVSADSMQLYRGMDTGTAKLPEKDREGIVHHMIDVADPDEPYSVAAYQKEAKECIGKILARGRVPIVCGGSGLHVNSITHNLRFDERAGPSEEMRQTLQSMQPAERHALLAKLDPESAGRVHPNNEVRVVRALEIAMSQKTQNKPDYDFESLNEEYDFVIAGINPDRDILRRRLDARVDKMAAAGLADEVRRLRELYPGSRVLSAAIGYKELLWVKSAAEEEQGFLEIKRNTKHLAKRQRTWFKRDPRIVWFEEGTDDMLKYIISQFDKKVN